MSWQLAAAVALGGGLGALMRHLVNLLTERLLAAAHIAQLPVATFSVNLVGSFVMGLLAGGLLAGGLLAGGLFGRLAAGETGRAFLATGLLGGLTTFSAFSLELGTMLEQKQYGLALGYGGLSVAAGLGAFLLGLALARGTAA